MDLSAAIPISEMMRIRRKELGLTQEELAQAVVVASDWPTVTNNEIARWERGSRIPRSSARRALEHVLGLPSQSLDHAAAAQRNMRRSKDQQLERYIEQPSGFIGDIRAALVQSSSLLSLNADDADLDAAEWNPAVLRNDLAELMAAYQASNYQKVFASVAEVISDSQSATNIWGGAKKKIASETLALACQSAAMVLTKQGETDLAWLAAERGLAAANDSENSAVVGSLLRSALHTLHSQKQTEPSIRLAGKTAEQLKCDLVASSPESVSIYGTFLLTSSMAAARAGDKSEADSCLDEADHYAAGLSSDSNFLWTSFGKANVDLHRVSAAVALDDISQAHEQASTVNVEALPLERQIRHTFDLAIIALRQRRTDDAIGQILKAYRKSPEQVSNHQIGKQVIRLLRYSNEGLRHSELGEAANRVAIAA